MASKFDEIDNNVIKPGALVAAMAGAHESRLGEQKNDLRIAEK